MCYQNNMTLHSYNRNSIKYLLLSLVLNMCYNLYVKIKCHVTYVLVNYLLTYLNFQRNQNHQILSSMIAIKIKLLTIFKIRFWSSLVYRLSLSRRSHGPRQAAVTHTIRGRINNIILNL